MTLSLDRPAAALSDAPAQLREAALFAGVSTEDADALCAKFDYLHTESGETLFGIGSQDDHLYIVIDGRVKLTSAPAGGREQLIALMGSGDQFGELSIFDPGPRTSTAVAITPTVLARASAESVRDWVHARPHVALQLLRVIARRLRRTNTVMSDLIFIDVPGRIAKQLVHLAQRFGTAGRGRIHVDHGLSQVELAQLVGCSRETVNKALSDFANRGWIRIEAKSVIILDPTRLARRGRTVVPPAWHTRYTGDLTTGARTPFRTRINSAGGLTDTAPAHATEPSRTTCSKVWAGTC